MKAKRFLLCLLAVVLAATCLTGCKDSYVDRVKKIRYVYDDTPRDLKIIYAVFSDSQQGEKYREIKYYFDMADNSFVRRETDTYETEVNIDGEQTKIQCSYTQPHGYDIIGYFDRAEGGNKFSTEIEEVGKSADAGQYAYAQYEPKKYTIHFEGDGTIADRTDVAYGSEPAAFPVPASQSGKKFVGWFAEPQFVNRLTDAEGKPLPERKTFDTDSRYQFFGSNRSELSTVTVYAQFADNVCNLTLRYGRDLADENRTVAVGEGATDLPTKLTADAIVTGWAYDENGNRRYNGEPLVEDTTLYAVWTQRKVYSLWSNGEKCGETNVGRDQTVYTDSGDFLVERDGYTFDGWYSDPTCAPATRVYAVGFDNGFSALFAKWTPKTYSIVFDTSNTPLSQVSVPSVQYTPETPTFDLADLNNRCPEHYEFVGWCTDAARETTPMTQLEIGTVGLERLYAKVKGIDAAVTLDMQYTAAMQYNDGVKTKTVAVEYGKNVTLAPPVNKGWHFKGWFSQSTGGTSCSDRYGELIAPSTFVGEVTLYAQWEFYSDTVYTVQYDTGCSVKISPQYYELGERLVFPQPPVNGNKKFDGWYVGNIKQAEGTIVSGNMTLVARWVD